MDLPDAGMLIAIAMWAVAVVIGLWISWAIIRSAVRRALRDHQQWLEDRGLR